jgi:hypothetical protein
LKLRRQFPCKLGFSFGPLRPASTLYKCHLERSESGFLPRGSLQKVVCATCDVTTRISIFAEGEELGVELTKPLHHRRYPNSVGHAGCTSTLNLLRPINLKATG